jgi:hypothetical protein
MHREHGDRPYIGDCCEDVTGKGDAHLASPEASHDFPALANKEGLPIMRNTVEEILLGMLHAYTDYTKLVIRVLCR